MPEGHISGMPYEGLQMKRFWSCFKSGKHCQEKIRKIFLPRHGNEATFAYFSTFQTLDYSISKNIQTIPCGFIRHHKIGPLNKCAKFH